MEYRLGLAAGTLLAGEYRIDGTLRQDGFCITYDAEDLQLKRRVLIKEYFPAEIADRVRTTTIRPKSTRQVGVLSWGRQRFIEEAQTLTKFGHPGIARVKRVFEENNTAYSVLDAEDWPTLLSYVDKLRRQPTQNELDQVARQLLDALEVLHGANVLVRDLSPESIYLRDKRQLVLMDFGTAKFQFAGRARKMHTVVRPGYSAPEQYLFDDTQHGPWTDIFSLAAVLYRLFTGRSPQEVIHRHHHDDMPKAAAGAGKDYRLEFLKAIDRGMELAVTDRPQSVKEFRAQLLEKGKAPAKPGEAQQPTTPPAAPTASPPAAKPDGPRPVIVPAGEGQTAPPSAVGPAATRTPPQGRAEAAVRSSAESAKPAATPATFSAFPSALLSDKAAEDDRLGFAALTDLPEPAGEDALPAKPDAPRPEEKKRSTPSPSKLDPEPPPDADPMALSSRRFMIAVTAIIVGLASIIGFGLITLERTLRQDRPAVAQAPPDPKTAKAAEPIRPERSSPDNRSAAVSELKRLEDAERRRQEQAAKAAEQKRAAEEAERKKQEAIRLAEERRQAEDAERKREEAARREAEQRRIAEAAEAKRKEDEARKAADQKRMAEESERQRVADEAKKAAEQKRLAELAERRRIEDERKAAEQKQIAAEAEKKRREDDARRAVEQKRLAEEAERQRLQDAQRAAEQKRLAEEAQRLRQEQDRREGEQRRLSEEADRRRQAEIKRADDERRLAEARRAQEAVQLTDQRIASQIASENSRDGLLRIAAANTAQRPAVEKRLGELGYLKLASTAGDIWRKPGAGEAFRDCSACPPVVLVPGGQFLMGSPAGEAGRQEDEDDTPGPGGAQVRITIPKPLAVTRFEITRADFSVFVAETGHKMDGGCYVRVDAFELFADLSWKSPGFPQDGEHPVACVSWLDAKAYASWLSRKSGAVYRLLSEAEWEYAARGAPKPVPQPRFPFGNSERDLCAFGNGADASAKKIFPQWRVADCNDGYGQTAPAGSFEPNAAGLQDMLGNLWEWVEDCYHDSYRNQPEETRRAGAPHVDGCLQDLRVLRGGSWSDQPDSLRPASRIAIPADKRVQIGGFRLAREVGR